MKKALTQTAVTRAQAIKNGALEDVSKFALAIGLKCPVALTHAVMDKYVELTPMAQRDGDDATTRLSHILWMLRGVMTRLRYSNEELFDVCVITDRREPSVVTLKASACRDEDDEWSVTVLLPDEDDPVTEQPDA